MDVGRVRLQYHNRVIARTINGGGARCIQNKTQVTATREVNPDVLDVPMFNLELQGFSVDTPQDEGLDVDMDADAGSRTAEEDGRLDSHILEILWQFWADALNKAPNHAGAGETCYLKLLKEERPRVGEEVFQNAHLSDYWQDVYYKVAPQKELEVAFGNIFSNLQRTSKPANTQNYFQMQYFQRWSALCTEVDDQTIEAMWTELKKKEILEKVGDLDYQLDLLQKLERHHPIFHIDKLYPFKVNLVNGLLPEPLGPIKLEDKDEPEYDEVEDIVDS
ncbi:hypothetical protein PQX77_020083 [Marasmius sp. AFHP31]|nr:hypothetical protein PQX77_020083 [Marasmius sp. AFHP31]